MSSLDRLQKLQQLVEQQKNPQYQNQEDRPYTPEKGKDGNAYALVRWLWNEEINELPYVSRQQHSWKETSPTGGKDRWFIENCPTTFKEKCPVCEANSEEYTRNIDSYRKNAAKRKRALNYYGCVYIIKDPKHPENEGTVQLFRFGNTIKKMLDEAISPTPIEGMDPPKAFDPFDLDNGANFHLIYKTVSGQNNVDSCRFDSNSAILTNSAERKEVLSKCKNLSKLLDRSQFKSYDELKKKFEEITGKNRVAPRPEPKQSQIDSSDDDDDLGFDLDFDDFKD